MTTQPDIFTNVHKGLRRALFETCVALGRAGDDAQRIERGRAQLREVLHFVAHHGENEDLLLVPLLDAGAPEVAERMRAAHAQIDVKLAALVRDCESASSDVLYQQACEFTAVYLEHMREEEQQLEPVIRDALSGEQLAGFGRGSIERTEPGDQRMMLGWMLPAMTGADAEAMLAMLPVELVEVLAAGVG